MALSPNNNDGNFENSTLLPLIGSELITAPQRLRVRMDGQGTQRGSQ